MSDVDRYIEKREKSTPGFKRNVEKEYENLKIGERIKQLRLEKGMTQEELAKKLHTTKSAISRLENHAESMRLSTIERVADVFEKRLAIVFE